MWACHGPSGQSIATPNSAVTPTFPATAGNGEISAGCSDDSGPQLGFTAADPAAGSRATVTFSPPGGVSIKQIRVMRRTSGFGGAEQAGNRQHYTLSFDGVVREERSLDSGPRNDLTDELVIDVPQPTSGGVTFQLNCDQATQCPAPAAPVSVDIIGVAFLVSDTDSPSGGTGHNNPVDDAMIMSPTVTDHGVGLGHAEVTIQAKRGGQPVTRIVSSPFGDCNDLEAGGVKDLPLDPNRCMATATKSVVVDTSDLDENRPDNPYLRTVRIFDAAGNQAATPLFQGVFDVWHPVAGSPIQHLTIGTTPFEVPEPNPATNPSSGGVGGVSRGSCRSPRLSVFLDQRPLRISRGVPVLQSGKRYRFRGRLTCVIDGRRRSAPKRTRIEVFNQVGRRTVRKPATLIRDRGAVRVILAYRSARTLIFRYTNADGQRSQVRIRIRVGKKPRSTR
jgi:hypothetical protein